MRERREKERARERSPQRESAEEERECTGRCSVESETWESQTRESRCVDATNAGFETRV